MRNLNNIPADSGPDPSDPSPALTLEQVRDLVDLAANGLCMLLHDPDSDLECSDEQYDALDATHNSLRTEYKTLRRTLASITAGV